MCSLSRRLKKSYIWNELFQKCFKIVEIHKNDLELGLSSELYSERTEL